MPKILIIAGPNGAGKTTFAEEFLPNDAACFEFVNADLIAAGLSPFRPERVAIQAGRLLLKRIRELVDAGEDFAIETTLATRCYLKMIPRWQKAGYTVHLYFLKLPNPDFAVHRVAQRVRLGGHFIPEKTIRQRFARGWKNLNDAYIGLVDTYEIYDASKMPPQRIEIEGNDDSLHLMEDHGVPHKDTREGTRVEPEWGSPILLNRASVAEAALQRASLKAIARARSAGLEPIIEQTGDAVSVGKE